MKDFTQSHTIFREAIVEDLESKLFGPTVPDDKSKLLIDPLQQFGTGVLFPQKLLASDIDAVSEQDAPEADELDDAVDVEMDTSGVKEAGADTDASEVVEPLNLANEFSPSAAGISFRVGSGTAIRIAVTGATYSGSQETDEEGRSRRVWTREPFFGDFELSAIQLGAKDPLRVDTKRGKLSLRVTVRKGREGSFVVSAMLVNEGIAPDKPKCEDCFFQAALVVKEIDSKPSFLPIDRAFGENDDRELRQMNLLYRHRRAFALGHGTASDWNREERLSEVGSTDMVCTAALPQYELKPISPRIKTYRTEERFETSMGFLFDAGGAECVEAAIVEKLHALIDDYDAWINDQERQEIPADLAEAASENIEKCRKCSVRMRRGVDLLEGDPEAMLAFRLMNKAMFMQQYRSNLPARPQGSKCPEENGDGHDRVWRPFQLGFMLMNLCSVGDPGNDERDLVELIWFPTGGGKTEAYLGLAAYVILLRRLRGEGAGTTVLMRYTLRLLTSQQFERGAAMILALEAIRRERTLDAELGLEPISIGLWVGQSLTPNRRVQAKDALSQLQKNKHASNPFQVLQCPWCGCDFVENTKGYKSEFAAPGVKTVVFRCPDSRCRFGRGDPLPVIVIDEDIYESPPTLVIGTVDKFAQISWDSRTGSLFGIGTEFAPPSMIIQDELHLISGPLGTIVGLYETAIDELCYSHGERPKIIASTATIRRASEQCEALYARKCFEFPPQGTRAGESYFAFEDQEAPGRLYVGFLGNALTSHQTALVRACSPLLQFPCRIDPEDEAAAEVADPYGTLVWYFNTLRELGHAATLCVGDIPEYLKQLCRNDDIPPAGRRKLYDPAELTSRRTADEIPRILKRLEVPWKIGAHAPSPIDILLATNMIAVGVDVPRLGLMVVNGQPKGTSEYIQATSRVGRRHPGLVVVVYTQTKNRDRSHYERFVGYHQSLYRYVEPTSVTPFSPEARLRGMRGLLIALARLRAGLNGPKDIDDKLDAVDEQVDLIMERVRSIDTDEMDDADRELREWLGFWRKYKPPSWGSMGGTPTESTLMYPYGSNPHPEFQDDAWPILTSMRNVDGTSSAKVLNVYPEPETVQNGE